jgi:hypothetical protein
VSVPPEVVVVAFDGLADVAQTVRRNRSRLRAVAAFVTRLDALEASLVEDQSGGLLEALAVVADAKDKGHTIPPRSIDEADAILCLDHGDLLYLVA